MSITLPSTILLTGATGFLGKVVLEELLRRSEEYFLNKIVVVLRSSKDLDPQNRFIFEVASSPCFNKLNDQWREQVEVVQGDLTQIDCGIDRQTFQKMCLEVTHIINCAACVDFDLPLADAAEANVGTALNLLNLAKACPNLRGMVHTSTSYVIPHNDLPISPVVAPLPYPAADIYHDILNNRIDEDKLLKQTRYPNTYSLTKCLAEHIYLSHKDSLPLTIIRPSIISCAWKYPTPGWIDSKAALAGFIALMGAGYLRVVNGRREAILDVVPVDVVANDIIDEARLVPNPLLPAAWNDASSTETLKTSCRGSIVHSVAGIKNGLSIEILCGTTTYFQDVYKTCGRSKLRKPRLTYLGPRNLSFYILDLGVQRLPLYLASLYFGIARNRRMARKTKLLARTLKKINKVFQYYTYRTFDFEPGRRSFILDPMTHHSGPEDIFTPERYVEVICEGVREHLLKL